MLQLVADRRAWFAIDLAFGAEIDLKCQKKSVHLVADVPNVASCQ